jgi:hypothetical protein
MSCYKAFSFHSLTIWFVRANMVPHAYFGLPDPASSLFLNPVS